LFARHGGAQVTHVDLNMIIRVFCALLMLFPFAVAAKGASPCATEMKSVLYYPGDPGFNEALDFHNSLVSQSSVDAFQKKDSPSWKLASGDTAYVRVEARATQCGINGNFAKFGCDYVGCSEPIPGTSGYSPGDSLSTTSCNTNTFVQTTTTWIKQQNGNWTVTIRNSEQHTSCGEL
jgi:hypothetical protein